MKNNTIFALITFLKQMQQLRNIEIMAVGRGANDAKRSDGSLYLLI